MEIPFKPLEEEVGDQTWTQFVLRSLNGPQQGPCTQKTSGTRTRQVQISDYFKEDEEGRMHICCTFLEKKGSSSFPIGESFLVPGRTILVSM
jgi:hypothetical protein